jgi:tetratricopeptide (TPR) repeat protein
LHVYNVFLTDPQEALTAVHEALALMPGEPRLIALEEKVVEQLKKASFEERKLGFLKQAQARIDAKQFSEAVQILESAEIECGESPDFASLLTYAQEQHRLAELAQNAASAMRDAQALIAAGELDAAVALLQPVALETKDPSVEQLLRQATAGAAELVRRIDAVVARGLALGDKDPEKALQFLSSQSQDIQNHSRVRELSVKLNAAYARERSTTEAIDNANAALKGSDRQAPSKQAEPVAARPAVASPTTAVAKAESGFPLGLFFAGVAVVVLAAAGAAYWFFLRSAPVGPLGVLELNATPYAEVVSVTSHKGKTVALPAGDRWTPLRLDDVPVGNYTVTFKGPDGATKQQQCSAAQSVQICSIELQPIDDSAIDQIVGGAK